MRITLTILGLAAAFALSGCDPSVPDSGNVVYLEPVSPEARAARDAALQGPGLTAPETVTLEPVGGVTTTSVQGGASGTLSNDATYQGGAAPSPVGAARSSGRYEVVAAKPVPQRPKDTGPSVVGFALATSHPVGQSVYPRNAPSAERSQRACARYASADLAQAAFLNSGGPQTDSQGLDPDGDGYACGWNPQPFRQAVR